MKVLHLISSGGMYGAEVMLLNLVRGLVGLRTEIVVGVFNNRNNPHFELAHRVEQSGIPTMQVVCGGRLDFQAVRHIRSLIQEQKFDLVHTHGYKADIYTFFAARFCSTPLVATSHGWTGKDEVPPMYNRLDRMVLRGFDRVTAVSAGVANKLLESNVAASRLKKINNGVDLTPYEAYGLASQQRLETEGLTIGMVGRLVKEKGCDIFLKAAKEVLERFPKTRFSVVGEGPEKESLKALTRDLAIEASVEFTGHCEVMPKAYALMDICVLPSFLEAMPMTIMEAMASGKPVVATEVGEIPNMVTSGEEGFLVQAGSVAELSESMKKLINDCALRLKMGARGRARAKASFSSDTMARAYQTLYLEVLSERQKHALSALEKT